MDDTSTPVFRVRVAAPLALLLVAVGGVYLAFGRVDPFETVRPPPATDWTPAQTDEVTRWAWSEGMNSYVLGDYEDAATTLGRAAGTLAGRPEPQFYAGVSNLMCERHEPAVFFLQRAVDLSPEDPKYRYYMAVALHEQGDDEGASLHLEMASGGEGSWATKARRMSNHLR